MRAVASRHRDSLLSNVTSSSFRQPLFNLRAATAADASASITPNLTTPSAAAAPTSQCGEAAAVAPAGAAGAQTQPCEAAEASACGDMLAHGQEGVHSDMHAAQLEARHCISPRPTERESRLDLERMVMELKGKNDEQAVQIRTREVQASKTEERLLDLYRCHQDLVNAVKSDKALAAARNTEFRALPSPDCPTLATLIRRLVQAICGILCEAIHAVSAYQARTCWRGLVSTLHAVFACFVHG